MTPERRNRIKEWGEGPEHESKTLGQVFVCELIRELEAIEAKLADVKAELRMHLDGNSRWREQLREVVKKLVGALNFLLVQELNGVDSSAIERAEKALEETAVTRKELGL